MTKSTSVFLDGLRVLAALVVFAFHCVMILYSGAIWIPGDAAVILFFVLSGYVIAYSTLSRKNMTARRYTLARLSRLYSVVIPALVLTAVTVGIGEALHLSVYDHYVREHDALRFVLTALFLQSAWWHNMSPAANSPFWSLGYEFWYYAIFGGLVFIRNVRWKWIFVLACGLIVGSNVLLLFPVWLRGVALYLYGSRLSPSPPMAVVGFVVATMITAALVVYLPEYPQKVGQAPLYFSSPFLTDWLLGLGMASVIWFYEKAWSSVQVDPGLARIIHWMANHSFSLYLFHFPLIVFFYALGIFNLHLWWSVALEVGLILLIIVVLAEFTESRRKPLQEFLDRLGSRLDRSLK